MIKKDMLFNMISKGEIRSCTLVGKPVREVIDTYFKNDDLMEIFNKNNIKNELEHDRSDIGIYFPVINGEVQNKVCSISITRESLNIETLTAVINCLFNEVYEYYSFKLSPYHFEKLLNDKVSFEDIILFTGDSQATIAEKIGKSRQLITDMKSGKAKMGIDTLAKLMQVYPLLPWEDFIRRIN